MSDALNKQIRDYFAHVDEAQGAVDVTALTDPQKVQELQPFVPPPPRRSGWAVGLAAAAAVAALVIMPLLFIAFVDEPDVATTIPDRTLPETTVVTTTVEDVAPETTLPPTTLPGATTISPIIAVEQLVLRGDGIGIAKFGDDEETVIAAVTAALGDPWSDFGYHGEAGRDFCADGERHSVMWGDIGDEPIGGFFELSFARDPVRTVAGEMTGFVGYTSSASFAAGDGDGVVATPHPWLPALDELRLFDSEQDAAALYGNRLSGATLDEDDGIPPIVVSRHLDLGGPWQTGLAFWNGRLFNIGSGPCPSRLHLSLEGNGIGVARFGDEPETVIAAVSRVLGNPDDDTGFVDDQLLVGVVGFCGEALQRRVSWGNFDLGFVDQEVGGHSGFVAYGLLGVEDIHGLWTFLDEQWPIINLPVGVTLLDSGAWAYLQYPEDSTPRGLYLLGPTTNHPVFEDRWARLDLRGPWPVNLWFDEPGTDRITRITSTPCEP